MKNGQNNNMMYKPVVYNQNVVVMGNESRNGQQSQFLPSISGSSKKSSYINESPVLMDLKPDKKLTRKSSGFTQQVQQANQQSGQIALLHGKLANQAAQQESLKRELFQKQLENEDLRQRLQILEALTGRDTSFMSIMEDSSNKNNNFSSLAGPSESAAP